jgi:hypothetical protein
LPDSDPTHFNFAPRCLFCNKNSRRRNTRKGRYWRCRSCGELNPGPGMVKAIMGRFTTPPGQAIHAVAGSQPAEATRAAVTKIKGAEAPAAAPAAAVAAKVPASKAPRKPAAAEVKPAAPAQPPPKRGVLEGIAARVYG